MSRRSHSDRQPSRLARRYRPADAPASADELWSELARTPRRLPAPPRRRAELRGALALVSTAVLVAGGAAFWWAATQHAPPARPDPAPPAPTSAQPLLQTSAPPAVDRPAPPEARAIRLAAAPPAEEPAPRSSQGPPADKPAADQPPAESTSSEPASGASRAAFDRAALATRLALKSRNLEEASTRLDEAESLVVLPEQRAEVRGFRALAEQLSLFLGAVRAGLQKYEPGESIRYGDSEAAIVEVERDRVVLFRQREKLEFTLATMPRELMLLFAQAGADQADPDTAGFYGAFYWSEGDRDKARQAWRRAAQAGLDVDDLLPLADQAADAPRLPVPDPAAVEAATKELYQRFAETVVAANTAARKGQMAGRMRAAAEQSRDTTMHYAALDQAREWAVLGGDLESALSSIDEMARWFEVDALELKSEALGMTLAGKPAPKTAARVAAVALELSAAAQQAHRSALAETLADSAYAAARQARDGELVKQAHRWRNELRSQGK